MGQVWCAMGAQSMGADSSSSLGGGIGDVQRVWSDSSDSARTGGVQMTRSGNGTGGAQMMVWGHASSRMAATGKGATTSYGVAAAATEGEDDGVDDDEIAGEVDRPGCRPNQRRGLQEELAADVANGWGSGSGADTDDVPDVFYSSAEGVESRIEEEGCGVGGGGRRAGSSLRAGAAA